MFDDSREWGFLQRSGRGGSSTLQNHYSVPPELIEGKVMPPKIELGRKATYQDVLNAPSRSR